jgi:PmbA protein
VTKHSLKPEVATLVEQVLQAANRQGATSAEAAVSISSGFSTTVRMGDVETLEHNNDKSISLTVYFGKRSGSSSGSDFSPEAIHTLVEKACNIARFTEEDAYSGLADQALLAFDYPDLDLYHPWRITPQQGMEIALNCENIARATDRRITNSEGATLSTHENYFVYGNSHGFLGGYPSTLHSLSCVLIAKENNSMQRSYDYSDARDPKNLAKSEQIALTAVEKTVSRLNPQGLSTRQVPVIFAAEVARGLLSAFTSAVSGSQLYRKASFLVDHLGLSIFPQSINIDERPHLLGALGSAPFDSEGVSTRAKYFVKDGMLESYLLGSYSARKLDLKPTGNASGAHNLFINTTELDLPALLRKMDTGLLVTEVMGQGVNLVTGDYSRGASGFWVEKGEIQYPVEEITIAGNLKDMFKHIVAVANDVDPRGNIHTGSILLESMMVAGE